MIRKNIKLDVRVKSVIHNALLYGVLLQVEGWNSTTKMLEILIVSYNGSDEVNSY